MRLLRLLVEGRRKTVDDRTQSVLALVSLLKNYYPQALELCGDSVSSPSRLVPSSERTERVGEFGVTQCKMSGDCSKW